MKKGMKLNKESQTRLLLLAALFVIFFGEDVDAESLKKIVYDTLAFDCPVVAASVRNVQTQQLGGSRAGESVAEAQLNLARLNLSYTIIAPECWPALREAW